MNILLYYKEFVNLKMCDIYISKDNWDKHFVNNQYDCFLPVDAILKTGQHIKRAKYKIPLFDINPNDGALYKDRYKRDIDINTKYCRKIGITLNYSRINNLDTQIVDLIRGFIDIGWITKSSCIGHFSNRTDFYDKDCAFKLGESIEDFKKRAYLGSVFSEPYEDELAFFHIDFLDPHPEMKNWDFVINNTDYTIFHKHKK